MECAISGTKPASAPSDILVSVTQSSPVRVLVCDDQPDVLEALRLLLKGQGCQAVTVDSPGALLRAVRAESFDLILADLNYTRDTTSGVEGLDLLASLEAQGNATPVVVMTAWGSVDLAVEAMRRGACDFIQKPWDNERVMAVVRKQAESRAAAKVGAGDRRQRPAEALPARAAPLGDARLRRPLRAGARGGRRLLRLSRCRRPHAWVRAGRRLRQGRAGGAADGQPAGLLPQPGAARPAAAGATCCETVNRHFFDSTAPERFATLFFGIYDDRTRRLRYVNCGHVPPLLLRASGEMETLDPTATMIGAFRQLELHANEQVALDSGDTLLIYSDGVTEAEAPAGEEFGEERLVRCLRDSRGQSASVLVQCIVESVNEFSHGSRYDDVTVVAIRGV